MRLSLSSTSVLRVACLRFRPRAVWGGYTVGWPMAAPSGAGCVTPAERQARPEDYRLDVPQFGAWGRLIRAFPYALAALGHEVPAAVVLDDVSDPGGEGLPHGRRPWHPPRPLQPAYLDLLFRAGACRRLQPGRTHG